MASFDDFVRAAQLPVQKAPEKSRVLAVKPGARLATGGKAVIRPEGQTPFKPVAIAAEEDLVDEDIVADDTEGFPEADDPNVGDGGVIGGGEPDVGDRGTSPTNSPVGQAPIGGHNDQISIGSGMGSGSGDGVSGILYACGEQSGSEFGFGSTGPSSVVPPRRVPGIPACRFVDAATATTFAVSSSGLLHVAGNLIQNPGEILDTSKIVTEEVGDFSSVSGFIKSGKSPASSVLPFVDFYSEAILTSLSASQFVQKQGVFAQSFGSDRPFNVSAIQLQIIDIATRLPVEFNGLDFTPTMQIFKAEGVDFLGENVSTGSSENDPNTSGMNLFFSVPRVPVCSLVFEGFGLPVFKSSSPVSLTPGVYVVKVSWPGQSFYHPQTPSGNNQLRDAFTLDGAWSRDIFSSLPMMIFTSDPGDFFDIRRIQQSWLSPLSGASFSTGEKIVSVKLFLRSVFSDGQIGVRFSRGSVVESEGYRRISESVFPGGSGEINITLSRPFDPAGDFTFSVETFGDGFEVASVSTTGAVRIASTGAAVDAGARVAWVAIKTADASAAATPSFGRNAGISVPQSSLESFVTAAENIRFLGDVKSALTHISAMLNSGADLRVTSGGSIYATGETFFRDEEIFSLVTRPSRLSLLDGDESGAILLRLGQVYSVGSSQNGRLGFSGSENTPVPASAPPFITRGKLTPLNGVISDVDGRIFGAGRALSGGWNAIPQDGIQPSSNPSSSAEFQVISAKKRDPNAWDLGGDTSFSFLLASDADGLWASGKLDGVFQLDALTNIAAARQYRWIRAGYKHALLLTAEGDLYGIGSNSHGQLGLPLSTTLVTVPTFIAGGIARAFAAMNKTFILAA